MIKIKTIYVVPYFRDDKSNKFVADLLDILSENDTEEILIDIDGCRGYSPSFIRQISMGIASEISSKCLSKRIKFKCQDEPSLLNEILSYISMFGKKNASN